MRERLIECAAALVMFCIAMFFGRCKHFVDDGHGEVAYQEIKCSWCEDMK